MEYPIQILIIDAQGGGVGRQLVSAVRQALPDAAVTAVGTNSAATGENAVVVACRTADIIVGPLGIVIADAMLGEVTPAMAAAVGQSRAKRVLIPFSHCDNIVAGVPELATGALIQCAVRSVTALAGELADGPLESSEGRA